MLSFLQPKSKLQVHTYREIPIESLRILGIAQVNPYYSEDYQSDKLITLVCFANESKDYDEKEAMVLTSYFALRRCPKCKHVELLPVEIKINFDSIYLKHEEEIAYDAYEQHPTRRHSPTYVRCFCKHCSSCFEIRVKNSDVWIKESKKLKPKDLIGSGWEEYCFE